MFAKFYGFLIAAGAALAALFGLLYRATRQGQAEERAAQTAKALEQARRSNEVDQRSHMATDMELVERLRKHQRD